MDERIIEAYDDLTPEMRRECAAFVTRVMLQSGIGGRPQLHYSDNNDMGRLIKCGAVRFEFDGKYIEDKAFGWFVTPKIAEVLEYLSGS